MSTELLENESFGGLSLNSFRASAMFERTFDEGMALVEECARYLDGRGRTESRSLSRKAALVYAGESMRVTTRLMQAASWLLIQRAVQEGDMSPETPRRNAIVSAHPRFAWASARKASTTYRAN
jgi:regulator of CtrA degradation